MADLMLAAASADVTPPPGHHMDGYAAREGVATGTADPLRATLLWLSTPDDPGVAWLALDAVGVSTALAARLAGAAARACAGLPADRVIVCASHTHSGPSGWSGSIHPLLPAERAAELEEALVASIAAMDLDRAAVSPLWCEQDAPGVGANRHRIDGPHDTTAGVLALRSPSGDVRAVLLDYACHPTVLGPDNLAWSADWPGATRRALAGAAPVVAFLQGAAGDVSPRFVRRGRDAREVDRLGSLLADPVRSGLHSAAPIPSRTPRLHRATVTLPVRTLPSADEAARILEEARRGGDQSRYEGACGLARMVKSDLPSEMELPIAVATLGEVAWVHLPVELFASLGGRIAEGSPFPVTRVIGYTGGYFGYVADGAAHDAGTYEALMSYFSPESGEALVQAVLDLLKKAFV